MDEIRNWTAKRLGGRMTIYGEINGVVGRVVGVDTITVVDLGEDAIQPGTGRLCPVATDKNGVQYRLA